MTKASQRRKATIYDIAVAAETSPSTVSIVLNGHALRYRISEETADRVVETARRLEYHVNTKARALRLSRSGLAGMVVANYRNRFFAGLVEAFEMKSRSEGLCPLVASGQRDPMTEFEVTDVMIKQQVEMVFFAGVKDPAPLNAMCRAEGIRCVNIDLPDTSAPSVVTDNRQGARLLTECILGRVVRQGADHPSLMFIGGRKGEYATEERLLGFYDGNKDIRPSLKHEILCGYTPEESYDRMKQFYVNADFLPDALFVNSIASFEGVLKFLLELEREEYNKIIVGCFDWHPLAAALPFVAGMIEQNASAIIDAAFDAIREPMDSGSRIVKVQPRLILN
jgi:LacI family fructose operon transcriptional repressor